MKTKNLRTLSSIGWIILAAAIISLSGCATKKAAWGSMKNGMIMSYNAQPDQDLIYKSTFDMEQKMSVMEQEFTITAIGNQLFIMQPIQSKSNDLDFTVTIKDMSSSIETPRGTMDADLSDVIGKSFNLTVSRMGKELDYSEAKKITYDHGMGDSKSIASDMQAFFPDLPDHPIKPGDSWNNTDDILEETGSNKVNLVFSNIHTFENLETYNGYECMKIKTVFTGTLEGKGEQDDMDLITKGNMEGNATWYYAYKEGLLISYIVEGLGKTDTEVIGGPQEMTIPASRTFIMSNELLSEVQ